MSESKEPKLVIKQVNPFSTPKLMEVYNYMRNESTYKDISFIRFCEYRSNIYIIEDERTGKIYGVAGVKREIYDNSYTDKHYISPNKSNYKIGFFDIRGEILSVEWVDKLINECIKDKNDSNVCCYINLQAKYHLYLVTIGFEYVKYDDMEKLYIYRRNPEVGKNFIVKSGAIDGDNLVLTLNSGDTVSVPILDILDDTMFDGTELSISENEMKYLKEAYLNHINT